MKPAWLFTAIAVCLALGGAAQAQIFISANDGKQLRPGDGPETRTPDSLSIIDIKSAPRVLATIETPATLLGPPSSAAVSPDGGFAVVTSAQKLNNAAPPALVVDDILNVIDLGKPSAPKIVQTLHPGPGVGAVSIRRDGKLALVTIANEDAVAVYAIKNKRLSLIEKVAFEANSKPTDVLIARDGRSALVTLQGVNKVTRLAIDGMKVTRRGPDIGVGLTATALAYDQTGAFAYNANQQGRALPDGVAPPPGPRMGAVSVIDLKTGTVEMVDVAPTPENVALSPDGRHLLVNIVNGSSAAPTSPAYNAFGLLQVYRITAGKLSPVSEIKTGQWCQGSIWSPKGDRIFLQCAMKKQIETYAFDGKTLSVAGAPLQLNGRPSAIGAAWSR